MTRPIAVTLTTIMCGFVMLFTPLNDANARNLRDVISKSDYNSGETINNVKKDLRKTTRSRNPNRNKNFDETRTTRNDPKQTGKDRRAARSNKRTKAASANTSSQGMNN